MTKESRQVRRARERAEAKAGRWLEDKPFVKDKMTTIEQAFTKSAISFYYPIDWQKNKHKDAEAIIVPMFNHTAKWYGKKASSSVSEKLKKSVHTKTMDEHDIEKLFKQLLKAA